MKKLFRCFIILLFLCRVVIIAPTKSYAETKASLLKFIGGIILTGGGIFLAIDGFEPVDISDPKLDLNDWNWVKNPLEWVIASGMVKNTRNVRLNDVKIYATYYDASNNYLGRDWTYLET